jgi:tetratricopeptide (TPR) repeat protein
VSIENEDNTNLETENKTVETPDLDTGGGTLPKDIDAAIDAFITKADHAPTKAPEDKSKKTEEAAPKLGADGKPIEDGTKEAKPGATSTPQGPQTQQVPTTPRKYGELFHQDQRGNIYNTKGELIAQQGAGHKLFRRLYPYIEKAELEAASYKAKAENYERATQAAKDAGLSLEENSAALSLMVAYKKDPKAAINFLLQQAEARGIDVSELRGGGASFDQAAFDKRIADLLEEKLQRFSPFVENLEQQRLQEQSQIEAREIFNEFMETNPDAGMHTASIAAVMEAHPQMTMEQAYFRLKTDALERGLDWKKPLVPQYQALNEQGNRSEPNGGGKDTILPDLNGRTGSGATVPNNRGEAGANDDWGSIIESAVAEVTARQQVRR